MSPAAYSASTALMMSVSSCRLLGPNSNTSGVVSTCNGASHGTLATMSQIDAASANPNGLRYSDSAASTYAVDGVGSAVPPRKIAVVLPANGSSTSAWAATAKAIDTPAAPTIGAITRTRFSMPNLNPFLPVANNAPKPYLISG
jgi:protoporphyrinogen oxidase